MATYQKVIQLKSADKEDAEFVSYTVKRRIANEKIKHAMEKANDVYNRMEEELIKAKKERTLARNNLVHAIYGVQVGELPKEENITEVLKNVSRSSIFNEHGGHKDAKMVKYHDAKKDPQCGEAGKNGPGFTLINDFYCLCVGKENDRAVCHAKIKGPGKWVKEDNGKGQCCCCCCEGGCVKCEKCDCGSGCKCDIKCSCSGNQCQKCSLKGEWLKMRNEKEKELEFEEGWRHIRKVCEEAVTDTINTSAESIQEVLEKFNKFLGGNSSKKAITPQNAEYDGRRLFVLGFLNKIENSNGCKGSGESICVNYWSVSNLGNGILWQNYMLEAQKHLQEMDKHVQKALRLSTMIHKLKESAEESYRNSTHGSLLWSEDNGFRKNIWHLFFIFFVFLV